MRKTVVVAAGTCALLVVMLGAAWACTPQPRSFAARPDTGAGGTATEIIGQGMPAFVPVEVRWDDLDGSVIGSAQADENGRFKAPIVVPDSLPGMHTVIFKAREGDGPVTSVGRIPFRVSPAGTQSSSAASEGTWSARSTAGGSNGAARLGVFLLAGGLTTLLGGALVTTAAGRRRARTTASPLR